MRYEEPEMTTILVNSEDIVVTSPAVPDNGGDGNQ